MNDQEDYTLFGDNALSPEVVRRREEIRSLMLDAGVRKRRRRIVVRSGVVVVGVCLLGVALYGRSLSDRSGKTAVVSKETPVRIQGQPESEPENTLPRFVSTHVSEPSINSTLRTDCCRSRQRREIERSNYLGQAASSSLTSSACTSFRSMEIEFGSGRHRGVRLTIDYRRMRPAPLEIAELERWLCQAHKSIDIIDPQTGQYRQLGGNCD